MPAMKNSEMAARRRKWDVADLMRFNLAGHWMLPKRRQVAGKKGSGSPATQTDVWPTVARRLPINWRGYRYRENPLSDAQNARETGHPSRIEDRRTTGTPIRSLAPFEYAPIIESKTRPAESNK